MSETPAAGILVERSRRWLSERALPLWLKEGVDRKNGGFIENLSLEGVAQEGPRRAMVQARQIYSFRVALDLNLCAAYSARKAVKSGADFLLANYSLPSGAFINSVDEKMKPLNSSPDLYGQAFALFALANAYAVEPRAELKDRARSLASYLSRERRAPGGGFTELGGGVTLYQSNPHMHLFEAAVCWMAIDGDAAWRTLADELLDLCLTKFIDPATGVLGEHFSEDWTRLLENGRFVFEPGHQYEWAWLMGLYQNLTGRDLRPIRARLFDQSEKTGISPDGRAFDQVWSDFTPKLRSSRFWPQCERVKAAAQLGRGAAADEALNTLFRYFDLPVQGLWYDTLEASGQFSIQPAKASSLYHIIGALSEYIRHRTVPGGS